MADGNTEVGRRHALEVARAVERLNPMGWVEYGALEAELDCRDPSGQRKKLKRWIRGGEAAGYLERAGADGLVRLTKAGRLVLKGEAEAAKRAG
jgi:hypothetical protein